MANIISNYHALPSSGSSTEAAKRQMSLGEASAEYVNDVFYKVFMHVFVSVFMSVLFAISASGVWQDQHHVVITAIIHFYSMVMVHLVLIRRRQEEKKQAELQACNMISTAGAGLQAMLTSMLMLVATGIVIISLGVAFFVFRPDWPDLAFIAIMGTVSTGGMFCLLGSEEINRMNALREKYGEASDRV